MDFEYKKIEKCVGCGLCKSVFEDNVEMKIDENGFYRPYFFNKGDIDKLKIICPLNHNSDRYSSNMWGKYDGVFLGYSLNREIREKGSSGGIITQTLVYLLENKKIDGVIHIGPSSTNPLENSTLISTTREEIIKNAGSRYAPTLPLVNLRDSLNLNKKYAFVGKPCDVRALKNYAEIDINVNKCIPYVISFFCMGTPSYLGTDKLIEELGFIKSEVRSLRYRGNGWPGFATAINNNGRSSSMSYNKSWGKITGKYLQPYCRWCADGVGEFADISCGDAWYLDENRKPKFDEEDGRSVIFARNAKGNNLISEMCLAGVISIEDFNNDISMLRDMNYSQFNRKATLLGKILALRLVGKDAPNYRIRDLYAWSKNTSRINNVRTFIGTILRRIQRKF